MKKLLHIAAVTMIFIMFVVVTGCETNNDNNSISNIPEGAIVGVFSISASQKIYFSQGNLQYRASTNTWRFAENQYDYVGYDNSNISSSYNGWIDLFGWGTSGYDQGAVSYQPWSRSMTDSDYYAYGLYTFNLNDQTGMADWGYNAICNGGNITNKWRTLTVDEWMYVLNCRITRSGIRYAKAQVNNVNGVILLPDDWSVGTYSINSYNTPEANFTTNVINLSNWNIIEDAGGVFLPAAGYRLGTTVDNVGSCGDYWSASFRDRDSARYLWFKTSVLSPLSCDYREYGFSVRLVCSANINYRMFER